jgi:hypothetical protein
VPPRRRGKKGDVDLIPVTVPEVRRLLAVLRQEATHQALRLHWSCWRRRRQADARRSHYKRRLAHSHLEVPL